MTSSSSNEENKGRIEFTNLLVLLALGAAPQTQGSTAGHLQVIPLASNGRPRASRVLKHGHQVSQTSIHPHNPPGLPQMSNIGNDLCSQTPQLPVVCPQYLH